MELRHLRYAVAVAQEGSFTRAAARLHVVQQALSQQIADLERELGVRIFERKARGISVTPVGTIFLEEAAAALARVDRTLDRVRHHAAGAPPTLRVGASPLFRVTSLLLASVVRRFRDTVEAGEVELLEHSHELLIDALLEGRVDVAFTHALPHASERVESLLVWEEPWTAALLPAHHPLATRHPLWLRDLAELPMILFPREVHPMLHIGILTALEERGLSPVLAPVRISGMPETDLELVASGVGWRLMVPSARAQHRGDAGVAFRSFADDPVPGIALWALSRRGDPSSLLRRFLSAVSACDLSRIGDIRPDAWRSLG